MARIDLEKLARNPFAQGEFYFSQSQRQLIAVDQMPLPYARNVMVKLMQEYGDEFVGSALHVALFQRLRPNRQQLRLILASEGVASVWAPQGTVDSTRLEASARRWLRGAGEDIQREVETHRKGDFIEGTCEPVQVNVRVKGERV